MGLMQNESTLISCRFLRRSWPSGSFWAREKISCRRYRSDFVTTDGYKTKPNYTRTSSLRRSRVHQALAGNDDISLTRCHTDECSLLEGDYWTKRQVRERHSWHEIVLHLVRLWWFDRSCSCMVVWVSFFTQWWNFAKSACQRALAFCTTEHHDALRSFTIAYVQRVRIKTGV